MIRLRGLCASRLAVAWMRVAVMALVALVVTWGDHMVRWHTTGHELHHAIKLWLYWSTWLVAPVAWWALCLELQHCIPSRKHLRMVFLSCVLAAVSLGLWAGLVEPNMLRVRETTLHQLPKAAQPLRLALVADIHWGLFFRDHQLQRLVDRLNGLNVDAVVVAGDWTYEPKLDLVAGFGPWKSIRVPVFGVLGNHDVESPGPALSAELRQALSLNGVQLLEGRAVPFKGWELVGLDDMWGGDPESQIQKLWSPGAPAAVPRLVLAHQPDTAAMLPEGAAFLILAGHTHGGQIWLPGITPLVLRNSVRWPWWDGLYSLPAGQLMVTPGVGTIGLPARLGVPPTIDVINILP